MQKIEQIIAAADERRREIDAMGTVVESPRAKPVARPIRLDDPDDDPMAAAFPSAWASTAHAARELPYASFGARAAAAIIDFIILQMASMFIDTFFAGMLLQNLSATTIATATLGPVVLGGALALIYSVWLESSAWQATPGKKMLGLKVVDVDGRRISFGKSSMRNVAKGLSMLTLGMGYLMPLWTRRRQALHDRAAGCLVIRAA